MNSEIIASDNKLEYTNKFSNLTNKLFNITNLKYFNLLFYFALFIFYLFLGLRFVYELNTANMMDYIFDSDSRRVFYDWTTLSTEHSSHFRTSVHPLYILLAYPIVSPLAKLSNFIFGFSSIGVVLFTSIISTLNVLLLSKLLDKLMKNKTTNNQLLKLLIIVIFSFSFSQLQNCIVIETYTLCLFSLLLFANYAFSIKDKTIGLKQYVILALLGVLCTSYLVTNIFVYIIGLVFLLVLNKKKSCKQFFIDLLKFVTVLLSSLTITALLCYIQKLILPTSVNAVTYFIETVKGFFINKETTIEIRYVTKEITCEHYFNVFKCLFIFNFVGGNITERILYNEIVTTFSKINVFGYISLILITILLAYSIFCLIKNKVYKAIPFIFILAFNVVLHVYYGNQMVILYALQFMPNLLILIFMGITSNKNSKINTLISQSIMIILALFIIIELLSNFLNILVINNLILNRYSGFNSHILNPLITIIETILLFYILEKYLVSKINKINSN